MSTSPIYSKMRALILKWNARALIFLFVVFCIWIVGSSKSFQQCVRDTKQHEASNPVEKSVSYLFIVFGRGKGCTGVFISENKDAVSAISTFVIAIFTVTLWIATSRLWRATTSLWSASERQHAISNRAFVFIEDFSYELTTADNSASVDVQSLPDAYKVRPDLFVTRFAAQPRWKNSGNTPTRNMTVNVEWSGPGGTPDYVYHGLAKPFFVAPNAVECDEFIEIPVTQALVDYGFRQPIGVEPLILLWGRADYRDVFGQHHFVEWCYRLRYESHKGEKLSASFIQWGDYNRSDEDTRAQ